MKLRRRKKPFSQGSISQIYELFFKPLVQFYKPASKSLYEFLEELFDVQHRYITRYRVKVPFRVTGQLYVAGWAKVQGLGDRNVPQDALIWVREDLREPAYVDVEVVAQGRDDQVFQVERMEWERLKLSCINLDLDD